MPTTLRIEFSCGCPLQNPLIAGDPLLDDSGHEQQIGCSTALEVVPAPLREAPSEALMFQIPFSPGADGPNRPQTHSPMVPSRPPEPGALKR